jgi:UDP-glucose 4-epimerase
MSEPIQRDWFIVGGAGFIGSHFADRLLGGKLAGRVTLYDNFSSGREWHYRHHAGDRRLSVIRGDVQELERLREAMRGHDTVIHLASNPDLARAVSDPDVDFREGTLLTRNVLEAMRESATPRILYASGSGIYGDLAEVEAREDHGPLVPVSTYGASKLAGEALIASYCHMFGMRGLAFRFGNVVGPRQTHGVGFDFVRRLLDNPSELAILGDGRQSKSYVHVQDIVGAVLLAAERCTGAFQAFNVATGDYMTVREIADLAVECVGLPAGSVRYRFSGGARGWKGDVPVVRLDTALIRSIGWRCARGSRAAQREALVALVAEARADRPGS